MSEWVESYRITRMEAGRQVAQERAARESVTRVPMAGGARETATGTDKPAEAKGRKLGLG
jgi:hypothetical protein